MTNIITFSGSPSECGDLYSEHYFKEIAGFFSQEFGNYKWSKRFVDSCIGHMKKYAPNATKFLQGVAKNSLLSFEQHSLLMLHEEEFYHRNKINNAGAFLFR